MLAPACMAQGQPVPRRPRGIYAVVNIEDNIKQQQKANPSITTAALNAFINNLYRDLLSNPAISGLTLQVHWDTLNPNPPSAANPYNWSYVDDAFAQVSAWDAQNPAQIPKTIQLVGGLSIAHMDVGSASLLRPVVSIPNTGSFDHVQQSDLRSFRGRR
ncbi:MAG TPA: hypothetical protein VNV82_24745 [Bryobacteraceae bacterium]|nr:hypothetical protein [Bryobacteraceae bacterium]